MKNKEPKGKERRSDRDDLLEAVTNRTLYQEIECDKEFVINTLNRINYTNDRQEIERCNLLKRILLLIGSADMKIYNEQHIVGEMDGSPVSTYIKASQNSLPVSTYICHGGRILIKLPEGTKDHNKLFNWLTDKKQSSILYNRYAASHSVILTKDNNIQYKEIKKSPIYELFSNVLPKFLGIKKKTNHWGIDLALGRYGGKNYNGNYINADGDNGHLYLYYKSPTKLEPGVILLGIEDSSPSSTHHSKLGNVNNVSVTGGGKWRDLLMQDPSAYQYPPIIPQEYNGMKIELSDKQIKKLINVDIEKYAAELAIVTPGNSLKDFLKNIASERNSPVIRNQQRIDSKKIIKANSFFDITQDGEPFSYVEKLKEISQKKKKFSLCY